jgi:hypothetical protein
MLAQGCGYRIGFGTTPGAVTLDSDPLHLASIEARADWTLYDFVARMESV